MLPLFNVLPLLWLIMPELVVMSGCSQQPNYAPVIVNNQVFSNETDSSGQQLNVTVWDKKEPAIDNRNRIHDNKTIPSHTVVSKNDKFTEKKSSSSTQKEWDRPPTKPSSSKFILKNKGKKSPNSSQTPDLSISSISSEKEKKSIISTNNKKMLKLGFVWPIQGKISRNFNSSTNKGIDIAGKLGQKVKAAEAGTVVYSGQGLIGLGNLVIIKHNDLFLSAYGNNSLLLVKEGDAVSKGQPIAQVGNASSKKTVLHFEIRKNGKPVNPLKLLPKSQKKL